METTSNRRRDHGVTGDDPSVPPPGPAVLQIGPARLTSGFEQHDRICLAAHEEIHGRPRPLGLADLTELAADGALCERDATAFPFARKLRAVADAAAHRATRPMVVIDGTEREPGSAKDTVLLTRAPHLVLDGAVLAAAALGAREIVVGVGDGPAAASVRHAIMERDMTARSRVVQVSEYFLGEESGAPPVRGDDGVARVDVGDYGDDHGFDHGFDHGGGDRSAGDDGAPRGRGAPTVRGARDVPRPHHVHAHTHAQGIDAAGARPAAPPGRPPARTGCADDLPALLSNAETLAQLAVLASLGVREYRGVGIHAEPGTVLLTVTGSARFPAVVEIPTGAPLVHLLDLCGANAGDGVLVGGYHGAWLGRGAATGAEVSRESLTAAGGILGTGVVMPIGRRTCPIGECAGVARMLAAEAARCAPCRPGLAAIAAALAALAAGRAGSAALRPLHEAGRQVSGGFACRHLGGLARFAASACGVFAADVAQHLSRGTCGRPVLGLLPAGKRGRR
jgi:NADH:ubiquinone oxidoreductase subunit F (NADH-binding)